MHDPASYVRARTRLPESELEWMAATARPRRLGRGEAFIGIGIEHHELGFIQDGIIQCYGVSYEGDKVVRDLAFPGIFIAALNTAWRGLASKVCSEAVKPVVMLVWPFSIQATAIARDARWQALQSAVIAEGYIRMRRNYHRLRTQAAQTRYSELDTVFPPEGRKVPLHIMASYLNITPQYLSALRRKEAIGKLRSS